MNKENLNALLDSIYELEGLVHLALTRDDSPARLPELIVRKGKELSCLASKIAGSDDKEADVNDDGILLIEEETHLNEEETEVNGMDIDEENLSAEPRGRLVFSINDRYRFKRELFANSDADFNNTLALVASMEGYDEAEDYFLGELQWDQKKTDVVDFLQIIKKYFKE